MADVCNWNQNEDSEWNLWETDCGQSFDIEEGKPSDNSMKFCCFCGKPLKEIVFHEDEEE